MAKGQLRSNKEKKKPKQDKSKKSASASGSQTSELFRAVDQKKTPGAGKK